MSTPIEWTDATWNPLRGCSKVSSGCKNCYAEKVAHRFSRPRKITSSTSAYTLPGAYQGLVDERGRWNGEVRFHPEKMDAPLRWRKPRMVFVNSMSDLFHDNVPDETIAAIFGVMWAAPWHTYQILTKRAQRMRDLVPMLTPPGCYRAAMHLLGDRQHLLGVPPDDRYKRRPWWLGVSVEDQSTANERIPLLLDTPAALRFVSYEPALGPVDFQRGRWFGCGADCPPPCTGVETALDWLIVGGESGPGARPCDVAWLRSTVEQCRATSVPCFVKQLGAVPFTRRPEEGVTTECGRGGYGWALKHRKGADPSEWPEDLRVREMPEVRHG